MAKGFDYAALNAMLEWMAMHVSLVTEILGAFEKVLQCRRQLLAHRDKPAEPSVGKIRS